MCIYLYEVLSISRRVLMNSLAVKRPEGVANARWLVRPVPSLIPRGSQFRETTALRTKRDFHGLYTPTYGVFHNYDPRLQTHPRRAFFHRIAARWT